MTTCKNCGTALIDNYCQHCGQKASTKRIEMKWLLHELPHAIWHIEKGFLYNVVQLTKRPGYAVVDYIEGKRKNFFHPISYLLIILAALSFIAYYLEIHWYDPVNDARMSEKTASFWKDYDMSQQLLTHHYFEFMAIYLPVASLIIWGLLLWLKRGYNFAESLVATMFMVAQTFILQTLALFVAGLIHRTAFTRAADIAGLCMSLLLTLFQFYQLGDTGVSKINRIVSGIVGAALLALWAFTALYIQTEWLHKK